MKYHARYSTVWSGKLDKVFHCTSLVVTGEDLPILV